MHSGNKIQIKFMFLNSTCYMNKYGLVDGVRISLFYYSCICLRLFTVFHCK